MGRSARISWRAFTFQATNQLLRTRQAGVVRELGHHHHSGGSARPAHPAPRLHQRPAHNAPHSGWERNGLRQHSERHAAGHQPSDEGKFKDTTAYLQL